MNFVLETPNTTELFTSTFKPDMNTSFAYDPKQPLYMGTPNGSLLSNGCDRNYANNLPAGTPKLDSLPQFDDCKTNQLRKSISARGPKPPKSVQKTAEKKRMKSTAQSKTKVIDTENPLANEILPCSNTQSNLTTNNQTISDIHPKQPKKRGPKKKPLTKEREVRLKNRRVRANARERTRMHSLNHALELLRNHVPTFSTTQRLSKIETLRLAKNYIRTLSELLGKETPPSPLEMALTLTDGLSQNTSNLIASTLQVSPRALIQLQRQINPNHYSDYTTDGALTPVNHTPNNFASDWTNDSSIYTNTSLNSASGRHPNSVQSPVLTSPLSCVTPPSISQTPSNYSLSVMSNYSKPSIVEESKSCVSSWPNSYPYGFIPECDMNPGSFIGSTLGELHNPNIIQQHHHQQQLQQQQQQMSLHQPVQHHSYQSQAMMNNFQPLCIMPLTNLVPRR